MPEVITKTRLKNASDTSIDFKVFRQYYDMYYTSLCRFLNLYSKDTTIIEDVIQEVFLKLWENRESVAISYVKTYLFHAAKNRILNYLRDEQNRHYLLEQWFNEQQEEKRHQECFDIEQLTAILERTIEQLPEKCREIFLLSRREQLSYKQIAEKQNLSIKTVETQMSIALKRIREVLSSSSLLCLLFITPCLRLSSIHTVKESVKIEAQTEQHKLIFEEIQKIYTYE